MVVAYAFNLCRTRLAANCIADAAAIGIPIDDMEPEFSSVEEIIYDAMQDILGDELVFSLAIVGIAAAGISRGFFGWHKPLRAKLSNRVYTG